MSTAKTVITGHHIVTPGTVQTQGKTKQASPQELINQIYRKRDGCEED